VITLTAANVFAAARLAYDNKQLSAQGPTPQCRYRDRSGRPCAVGAALTDEEAALVTEAYNMTPVMGLPRRLVTIELGNYSRIASLQEAHDNWARGTGTEDDFVSQLKEYES
jgi:hypothetical protein